MSPARDQFAKTTARFFTRSLLIVVAVALALEPKESARQAIENIRSQTSPPTNDPPIGLRWQRT